MKEFKPFQGVIGAFEGRQARISLDDFVILKQVHGNTVHCLRSTKDQARIHFQEGDALLCFEKNIPIAVKTADCVPILLAHPDGVVGAVHAGWRGTQLKILEKVLLKIRDEFCYDLREIHLAIGPAICGRCYEVGAEFAQEFTAEYLFEKGDGKFLLDLKRANFDLAKNLGVPESQMEILEDCTLCQVEHYHSFRHESKQGLNKEGRNYSWIMMS